MRERVGIGRQPQPAWWLAGLGLSGAVWLAAEAWPLPRLSAREHPPGSAESASLLMREGTRIVDRPVVCRCSGERLLITVDEDTPPLIALENLAAQRILKAVLDDAADERWIIDGQVTEFHNRNYLLLERVVRQAKPGLSKIRY